MSSHHAGEEPTVTPPDLSRLSQMYSTVLVNERLNLSFQFVTVPARSFVDEVYLRSDEATLADLQLTPVEELSSEQLVDSVARYLETLIIDGTVVRHPLAPPLMLREVADALMTAEVVPIEMSPLRAQSFQSVVAGTSAAATVLWAQSALSTDPHVYALVAILPIGLIVFGAARGIARGLEKGFEDRIVKLMRKKRQKPAPPRGGKKRKPKTPARAVPKRAIS